MRLFEKQYTQYDYTSKCKCMGKIQLLDRYLSPLYTVSFAALNSRRKNHENLFSNSLHFTLLITLLQKSEPNMNKRGGKEQLEQREDETFQRAPFTLYHQGEKGKVKAMCEHVPMIFLPFHQCSVCLISFL